MKPDSAATADSAISMPSLPPGVTVTTLQNGLTIIVCEDHSAPVVSAQAWCMAGSIHEGKWLGAGMSHVLEHMLFKGTTTRAGVRIDQEVQEAGGYMNAYTSFDRTVYHIDVPNTSARVAVDILCDIMRNATLPAAELEKEKQVILREMDMNQDEPDQRSNRRLFEIAYTRSPYHYTVIGYRDIFNRLKQSDLLEYYQEKYAPNNTFYVVVGDVKAPQIVAQIREAYATTAARALPPVVLPEEPRQTAAREIIEEAPIELAHFHISWHIPDMRHPDAPALDVLAAVVGSGRSSRLFQQVRERKALAHWVGAWTYRTGAPGLFGLSAAADADKFGAARQAMLEEIERVKHEPIPEAELAKAVKLFVSAMLSTRKTMQGQAQDLGNSWLGEYNLGYSARFLAAIKRLTTADLQRVARQYLTAENRTLFALMPAGTTPAAAAGELASPDHAIEKFTLPNGLRLLVKEDHRLPFVELRAVLQGGLLAETAENNGVTQLMSRLMLKGTPGRTAEQIATEIESCGGGIESHGGNNSFGVRVEVLAEDFSTGFDLLADVLLRPAFPEEELKRERELQLAALRSQKDELLLSAFRLMRSQLFGDRGYGLHLTGNEAGIKAQTVATVQSFYHQLAAPNNCVLAIFGDVKTSDVRAAVEAAFASWERANIPPLNRAQSRPAAADSIRRVSETREKEQAVIVIGFPGVTILDPDRRALDLIHEACSDMGSRLFLRIREQLGLAYYTGTRNLTGLEPGYFAFYAGTEPDKVALVEEEILKEVELLRAEGLSEEELKRGKSKMIGQRKIARQDLGGLASTVAFDELYGLGFDYSDTEDAEYQAVTLEQVKAAAIKHLRPGAASIAVIKP